VADRVRSLETIRLRPVCQARHLGLAPRFDSKADIDTQTLSPSIFPITYQVRGLSPEFSDACPLVASVTNLEGIARQDLVQPKNALLKHYQNTRLFRMDGG